MPKFRKRPVTIEAFQWTGSNPFELGAWAHDSGAIRGILGIVDDCSDDERYKHVRLKTLEGEMYGSPGDYIIVGVKGEVYACKPDTFELTYEAVEEIPTC